MKRTRVSMAVAIFASLFLAGGALAAGDYGKSDQKSPSSSQMQTQQMGGQQAKISTASDVQNFKVQTSQGEALGKVDKVVLDLDQGRIGYIVLSSTEGQDKYIVPWNALQVNPDQKTLTLNMGPELLKQAPKGDIQNVLDRSQGQKIHQFYGVAPYWEQGGKQQQQKSGSDTEKGSIMDQKKQQKKPGMGM